MSESDPEAAAAKEPDEAESGEPELTFESALSELEGLVEGMEEGETTLEDALRAFERGMKLQAFCQAALAQAEQKVRILTGDGAEPDGLAPFEPES